MMMSEYKAAIDKFVATFEIVESPAFKKAVEFYFCKFDEKNITKLQIAGGVDWLAANRTNPSKPRLLDLLKASLHWRAEQPKATIEYNRVPCDLCHGDGYVFILRYAKSFDTIYSSLANCICPNAEYSPIPSQESWRELGYKADEVVAPDREMEALNEAWKKLDAAKAAKAVRGKSRILKPTYEEPYPSEPLAAAKPPRQLPPGTGPMTGESIPF